MINESHVVRENTSDWKTNVSVIYFEKSQNSKIFKSIKTRNQVLLYKLFSKPFFGKVFAALHFFFVLLFTAPNFTPKTFISTGVIKSFGDSQFDHKLRNRKEMSDFQMSIIRTLRQILKSQFGFRDTNESFLYALKA